MKIVAWVLASALVATAAGCGGSPAPTLTGVAVEPHSILTWPEQTFAVVGLYSDHTTGALPGAEVTWTQDAWWVRLDAMSGSPTKTLAVCTSPAPLTGFVLPQPTAANIRATVSVNGQTFSDSGILYCH